jgi:hypothetical protein
MRGPGIYTFINSVSESEDGEFAPVGTIPLSLLVQDDN